jgi:hypothetical protein
VVADDETGVVVFLDSPGRREAAFCHGVLSHCYAESRAKGIAGMTLCTPPIISRLAF